MSRWQISQFWRNHEIPRLELNSAICFRLFQLLVWREWLTTSEKEKLTPSHFSSHPDSVQSSVVSSRWHGILPGLCYECRKSLVKVTPIQIHQVAIARKRRERETIINVICCRETFSFSLHRIRIVFLSVLFAKTSHNLNQPTTLINSSTYTPRRLDRILNPFQETTENIPTVDFTLVHPVRTDFCWEETNFSCQLVHQTCQDKSIAKTSNMICSSKL